MVDCRLEKSVEEFQRAVAGIPMPEVKNLRGVGPDGVVDAVSDRADQRERVVAGSRVSTQLRRSLLAEHLS